jgi:hypothetical protein
MQATYRRQYTEMPLAANTKREEKAKGQGGKE